MFIKFESYPTYLKENKLLNEELCQQNFTFFLAVYKQTRKNCLSSSCYSENLFHISLSHGN